MRTEQAEARGFTLLEIMVVLTLIALLAGMTMAVLTRSRSRGEEAAAIHALRTIQSAQEAFRATCGHGRDYAATLVQLGAAQTISPDLASGPVVTKSRYTLTMTATAPGQAADTCTQGETAAHWYASAVPVDKSGERGFGTTDNEDIWQNATGAAPEPPFAPTPTISRLEP